MKKRWKSLKRRLLKNLVKQRPLKPWERLSNRIGYMGAGFVIAGQWTIEPIFFIIGFICVILQVGTRKQWNLVALNTNGLIAWIQHLINGI